MRLLLVLSLIFALTACGTLGGPKFGLEQREPPSKFAAGEVNVTAFDPIPWYTISDAMKPRFGIKTAKDLLGDVAPLVGQDGSLVSRRRSLAIEAALSGTQINDVSTTNSASGVNEDGEETSSSSQANERTETRSSPDALSPEAQELASLISMPDPLSGTTYDPDLKYRAATALFQNIQLLDRYLDSPPGGPNKSAYLVRMQVTVNPYAHNQPYDVYVNLQASPEFAPNSEFSENQIFEELNGGLSRNVRLHPLIIGDNLERINTSRIAEDLNELRLALQGMGGLFSGGLSARNTLHRIRSLIGTDLNNTVTFSQIDDTGLILRLGAAFDAQSGYSMRPRTYEVLVVMVVEDEITDFAAKACEIALRSREKALEEGLSAIVLPGTFLGDCTAAAYAEEFADLQAIRLTETIEERDSLSQAAEARRLAALDAQGKIITTFLEHLQFGIFSETDLRHATDGTRLPNISKADISNIADLAESTGLYFGRSSKVDTECKTSSGPPKPSDGEMEDLWGASYKWLYGAVFQQNTNKRDKCIYEIGKFNLGLAGELRRANLANSVKYTNFNLPDYLFELPDQRQMAIFRDDGKLSKVSLVGQGIGDPRLISGTLRFTDKRSRAPKVELRSIEAEYDGRTIEWSFASSAELGLDPSPSSTIVELILSCDRRCRSRGLASLFGYRGLDRTGKPIYQTDYAVRPTKKLPTPEKDKIFKLQTFASKFETDPGKKTGPHITVIIDKLSETLTIPYTVDHYRIRIKGATLASVKRLADNGSLAAKGQPTAIKSKNAAKFGDLGKDTAFKIELEGSEVAGGTTIEVHLEAMTKDGKLVSTIASETLSIKQPS